MKRLSFPATVYIARCRDRASRAEQSAEVRRLLSFALIQPTPDAKFLLLPDHHWRDIPGFSLPSETRGAHGQPYPNGIDTPTGRRFVSLAHSGSFIAAAVAAHPVGLDIQTPVSAETALRVARRLPPAERAIFLAQPTAAWAAKESVLKLTGEGLSRPLASFLLTPDGDSRWRTVLGERCVCIEGWQVDTLAVAVAQWAAKV